MNELNVIFNIENPVKWSGESESQVLTRVKLEATQKGARLWRNNVGATYTSNGDFIRYGLANESKAMNQLIKSSDLIGIKKIQIGDKVVGQFIAREIKKAGWKFTGNAQETAQLNFIKFINLMGGDACFATSEGTIT